MTEHERQERQRIHAEAREEIARLRIDLAAGVEYARQEHDRADRQASIAWVERQGREYAERMLVLSQRPRGIRWALRQLFHGVRGVKATQGETQ